MIAEAARRLDEKSLMKQMGVEHWVHDVSFQESLELLFKIVGSDRCMFGTENPGTGSYKDPKTGKMLDDLKPEIKGIEEITPQDRKNVFEDVARKVFPRYKD